MSRSSGSVVTASSRPTSRPSWAGPTPVSPTDSRTRIPPPTYHPPRWAPSSPTFTSSPRAATKPRSAPPFSTRSPRARKARGSCGEDIEADRTVIVGPPGRWLAVYDEATESQDLKALDGLAQDLSRGTGGPAVAILVHDSSELYLRLFSAGASADRIQIGSKKSGGRVDRWSKVVADADVERLRAALAANDLLVEQTLEQLAGALGIDRASACTGCKYLLQDGGIPEGASTLRFRRAVRPAYEEPAEGPPRLITPPMAMDRDLSIGEEMHLNVSARNEGGAARGLSVVVHGEAIDGQLIEPVRLTLVTGRADERKTTEQAFARRTMDNGRAGFVAALPDFALPPGHAGGLAPLADVGVEKMIALQYASRVDVNVHGKALVPGASQVFVSCVPHQAREAQAHALFRLTIAKTPRTPLGAVASPAVYVGLETREAIVAYAVSTLEQREAAALAATAIERLSELWPAGPPLSGAISEPSGLSRPSKPRQATLRVEGFARSAGWKKLRAALATARVVQARRDREGPDISFQKRYSGDGFAFGGAHYPREDASDPELPTLRLGLDLRGLSDAPAALARVTAIVEEFATRAKCAQAFVARWTAWGAALDSSPFEGAYGVTGVYVFRRSWATRFLRGVSADTMWLGPELLARIDRAALETVAVVEPVGELSRIVLREGGSLDALERMLAALLPSREEGSRWNRWMYRHEKGPPWGSEGGGG